MKKRIIVILILTILIAFNVFLLRPYSFSSIEPDCTSITVTYIDNTFNTLEHDHETKVFERGTEKFTEIQSVLESYTYHRSFRTFSDDGSMEGNHAGYWLYIYLDTADDRKMIVCGGTGEISIDGRVYRVGYWGDGPSLSLMNEIVDIFYS